MHSSHRFETPENVLVRYDSAGLGTRFLAWFVDQILLLGGLALLVIGLVVAGVSFNEVIESSSSNSGDSGDAIYYALGLMALLWGLGSFAYFGLCELFLRGQTVGKRCFEIRVVHADGFQLDASSILVRNLFRAVDHLPPMWIIPLVSRRSQRSGDMVAGTVVVNDATSRLSHVRQELLNRSAVDAEFRFARAMLDRLSPDDLEAIERILDRWNGVPEAQQVQLLDSMIEPLAQKLQADVPPSHLRLRFLEDLLAAQLRHQDSALR